MVLPQQDQFLEDLYRDNYSLLYRYALSALNNPESAAEVVQDTFHEAVTHIEILTQHQNPCGWLRLTLKNKIRNSKRAYIRYTYRFFSMSNLNKDLPSPDSYDSINEYDNDDSMIEMIQEALTTEEFYMLQKIIFEKTTHKKMAEELGITIWSSQKRLQRIKQKLSKIFPNRKTKK